MSIQVANGQTSKSGILIPEVWSGKMLVKFYEACILAQVANTDYEGEIKNQGDTVHIRTVPNIEIRKYQIGQPLNIQRPDVGMVDLKISEADYWNFISDDIETHQSDIAYVEKWTEDAAQQLKISMERQIFAQVYADAAPENRGATAGKESQDINLGAVGSPLQLTTSNVIDFVVDANTVMDEQNLPESERFLVLPPWAINRIKRSEIKDASLTGDGQSTLRSGRVGIIDRTEVYTSNLLSTARDGSAKCWNIFGGHKSGLTFAAQLVKNESMKAESTFGQLYRGLHVYGWKVIKPESMLHGFVRK